MRGILDFVPLMRYHLEFAFQRLNCFCVIVIFFIISFDFGSFENITTVIFYSLPSKCPWGLLLEEIEDDVGRRQGRRGDGGAGGGGGSGGGGLYEAC